MIKKSSYLRCLPAAGIFSAAALVFLLLPAHEEPGPEKRSPSGAMEALDFWAAQRIYPGTGIPDAKFTAAWEQSRRMTHSGAGIDQQTAPWRLIGPGNIGGRTLCLALHADDPHVIFAGSASGGLWKSTTGGVGPHAWTYVETGFPVLGVSTIAIDPVDPDIMYIGTGEVYAYQDSTGGEAVRTTRGSYGIGILKTTDGGQTWMSSLDWRYFESRGVWMIAIHPLNASTLFAATSEGVYKSTDAGGSWQIVLDVIMATDVRIHPVNPDILFAACGNFGSAGHGIYRSSNGGAAWTKLTTGLPGSWTGKAQLAIAATDPGRIYASIANKFSGLGLYRSMDTGDSWTQVNDTDYADYQGWYSHYVVVSPFDENDLFVGGIEIWSSTDGGVTLNERSNWQEVYFGTPPPQGPIGGPHYAHADHHFAVWHPNKADTVFFASDGGIFKTTDGGNTYKSLIGGYATTQFYNGFSNSATDRNRAIGGMQDNFTAIYDGDDAWRRVIGGDGSWTAINPLDDDVIYGSAQYLFIVRSLNGGQDWSYIEPPEAGDDQTAFVAPFMLSPSNPEIMYAGRSRVYKSTDSGSNWAATNGGAHVDPAGNPVLCLAVSRTHPDIAYAGTPPIFSRAHIYRTLNGGSVWEDITGSLPDRYPSDLAVDPDDDAVVYVTFMGFGTGHVYRSENAGLSWQDIGQGLPDIPVSAVAVDPSFPEMIYVGTDLGVFLSRDGGQSWDPFTQGMPTAMVNDLTVFEPHRLIRAATHGNGVFERKLFHPVYDRIKIPGGQSLEEAPEDSIRFEAKE